jgi:gliding motility-associated-like protein
MSGSVWNNNRIDLTTSFDFSFIVYLGCGNQPGADGIAFVLQPISTSVGGAGGSMGVGGINPSVAVTLDTYQNAGSDNDPAADHIAIQLNGDVFHNSANNISATVSASATSDNIEDCKEHVLRVNWNAATKIITAYFDGQQRVTANYDLVQNVFSGSPGVFWGFTGATGGEFNVQRFCTALVPKFYQLPDQKRCANIPIQFFDSTIAFGGVIKRYWDFGDGSPIDSVSLNPIHTYVTPGNYVVRYRVMGIDGCEVVYTSNIIISSVPDADFSLNNICTDRAVAFTDQSTNSSSQINAWNWNFGSGFPVVNQQNPSITFPSPGTREISLWVTSADGCVSDTQRITVTVNPTPKIEAEFGDACFGLPATFNAVVTPPGIREPLSWNWNFGDQGTSNDSSTTHLYQNSDTYDVSVYAISASGCPSDTLNGQSIIYLSNANAGNDTIVAANQPVQLQATGGTTYTWSPTEGLSNPNISNPVAIVNQDQTYIVTSLTPLGCISTDTIKLIVYKGPEIYVPSAFTPNNDGLNDVLTPFSVGFRSLEEFTIFNRYGQQIFRTNRFGKGWNGTYNNKLQPTGTYVWMIKGVDYTGKSVFKKGTVMLLR